MPKLSAALSAENFCCRGDHVACTITGPCDIEVRPERTLFTSSCKVFWVQLYYLNIKFLYFQKSIESFIIIVIKIEKTLN